MNLKKVQHDKKTFFFKSSERNANKNYSNFNHLKKVNVNILDFIKNVENIFILLENIL